MWSGGIARTELLVRGAMLLTLAMLVFNKVGSPQYMGWLAPPVAVALALRLPGWRTTAWLVAGHRRGDAAGVPVVATAR